MYTNFYTYIYICVCVFSVPGASQSALRDPRRPSPAPAGRRTRSSRQLQLFPPSGTKRAAEDQGAGPSAKKQA